MAMEHATPTDQRATAIPDSPGPPTARHARFPPTTTPPTALLAPPDTTTSPTATPAAPTSATTRESATTVMVSSATAPTPTSARTATALLVSTDGSTTPLATSLATPLLATTTDTAATPEAVCAATITWMPPPDAQRVLLGSTGTPFAPNHAIAMAKEAATTPEHANATMLDKIPLLLAPLARLDTWDTLTAPPPLLLSPLQLLLLILQPSEMEEQQLTEEQLPMEEQRRMEELLPTEELLLMEEPLLAVAQLLLEGLLLVLLPPTPTPTLQLPHLLPVPPPHLNLVPLSLMLA